MTLQQRTATPVEAVELSTWAYPPPWERHSHEPARPRLFLTAVPDGEGYHPALHLDGSVVGFCVPGADARIPGQTTEPRTVDLGLGVRPGRTGDGLGAALLEQAVELARGRTGHRRTRVTVASDNARSLTLCRAAGFVPMTDLVGPGGRPFLQLVR